MMLTDADPTLAHADPHADPILTPTRPHTDPTLALYGPYTAAAELWDVASQTPWCMGRSWDGMYWQVFFDNVRR